ncbi:Cell division protein DivIB [compost metagenome]
MQEDLKIPSLPIPDPKPKSRSNKKLLIFLFLFFITVLIILFFQSSLSKVSEIEITGNELIISETIGQAAGINIGDHFFAISSNEVEGRIKEALKMMKEVSVTRHFPGVVSIEVKEYPRVAFQFSADGKTEAVLADGVALAVPSTDFPIDKPILTGWSDNDPNKAQLCKVLGELPASALSDISEIIPDATDSYPDKIKMFTRSKFEVYTTIAYLPGKIDSLPGMIASLRGESVTTGFINMLEVDNHAPFDSDEVQKEDKVNTKK